MWLETTYIYPPILITNWIYSLHCTGTGPTWTDRQTDGAHSKIEVLMRMIRFCTLSHPVEIRTEHYIEQPSTRSKDELPVTGQVTRVADTEEHRLSHVIQKFYLSAHAGHTLIYIRTALGHDSPQRWMPRLCGYVVTTYYDDDTGGDAAPPR